MDVGHSRTLSVMDVLWWCFKSPTGAIGFIVSALGWRATQNGGTFDLMDMALTLLIAVVLLACILFLLWALPKTFHVLLIWCGTLLVSMLTMGWCLNNEERCRASFVYTADKAFSFQRFLEDFALQLYGSYRRV